MHKGFGQTLDGPGCSWGCRRHTRPRETLHALTHDQSHAIIRSNTESPVAYETKALLIGRVRNRSYSLLGRLLVRSLWTSSFPVSR
jgi:hypothetical protein